MNTKYIIIGALAMLLGAGLFILEREPHSNEVMPDQLLTEIADDSRFISTDELAKAIVNEDPSYFLVDVRDSASYIKYSLPNAINIPIADLLKEDQQAYFEQEGKTVILFSNGSVYASQAWMLLRRLAKENMFILKGGLNQWASDILMPSEPASTADDEAMERYNTRLATKAYLGGGSTVSSSKKKAGAPKLKRKKKKSVDGGC